MAIPTYDFPDHIKGDTFNSIMITFSSVTFNAPIDVSGYEINIQFKENPFTTPAYAWSTVDGSIVFTDAVNGKITLTDKIIDAPASTYVYDVQIIDTLGVVKTYFKGSQNIIQDITI